MLMRLSRDPWVPWTIFPPLQAIALRQRAATDGASSERAQPRGAPPVRALLWVREPDGTLQRVSLPMGF